MNSNNLLIQTAVGDYRQNVLSIIAALHGDNFKILCGNSYFDPSTTTKVSLGSNLIFVRNFFLFERRLLWQNGVLINGINADNIILEFNPRILSNWVILIIRLLLRKKSVLWGHAWGRNGKNSKWAPLRRLMRCLSTTLLVYTEKQKKEVINEDKYKGNIICAPNSIYLANDMVPALSDAYHNYIYVGRLVESKNPERMIRAFSISKIKKYGCKLIIVGDGPLKNDLKSLCEKLQLHDSVVFKGHISDTKKLRDLYAKSLFSISPGYVGLSITQSLGFGVPMIISRDELHAPEIEAASEGFNCIYFEKNSEIDLARILDCTWEDSAAWIQKRVLISKICRTSYSAELMASRIIESLNIK